MRFPNAEKYKNGGIRTAKTKGGACRLYLKYRDEDGAWHQVQKTATSQGKKALENELAAWQAEMEAEALEQAGRTPGLTVEKYVAAYIEGRETYIERSTLVEYRRTLNKLIAPGLGDVELSDLTPDMVQAWVNDIAKEFAPVTVKKALTLLRSAMTQAVDRDVLAKNPTRTVKPPKTAGHKPNALDAKGRAKLAGFIALDPADPCNIGYALALYLGLREGEVCGLRWRDVDLERQTLDVAQSIGHESGKWYVKEPKNEGSKRTLNIPGALLDPLEQRRAQLAEEGMAAGVRVADMYVTGKPDGSFMTPHYLSSKWRTTADVLNLVGTQGKRPTYHDLRHTFATAALTYGADVKTVSSMMGHSNAAMTLNTYADADPDAKRRGAETVANGIAGEVKRHSGDGQVLELYRTGTEG